MTIRNVGGYRNEDRSKYTYLHGEPSRRRSLTPRSSVYYWWFEFLRRNENYRRCCQNGGRGKLAGLYNDFGDVFTVEFYEWFFTQGYGPRLFAEPPPIVRLDELESPKDWNKNWKRDEVMVVVVPLKNPKRRIHRWFSRVLDERHKGRPGHTITVPRSAYPVKKKFSTLSLEQTLAVYDCAHANPTMKRHEIGRKLRLVRSAMPNIGDSIDRLKKKRNTMSVTVTRYLKKAEAYIRNTANGEFPCAD